MYHNKLPLFCSILVFFIASLNAYSEPITISTWNIKEAFEVQGVQNREAEFKKFGTEISPGILFLQEVNSCEVVQEIGAAMTLNLPYTMCSDFSNQPRYDGFEVGVISRLPILQSIEYDPKPDNGNDSSAIEVALSPALKLGLESQKNI